MNDFAIKILKAYKRFLSRWLKYVGVRCIYQQPCSDYAIECLRKYSFVKATVLAAKRFVSCNPWTAMKGINQSN